MSYAVEPPIVFRCHKCLRATIVCDSHQLCELCEDFLGDVLVNRCYAKVTIAWQIKMRAAQKEASLAQKIGKSAAAELAGYMTIVDRLPTFWDVLGWKTSENR